VQHAASVGLAQRRRSCTASPFSTPPGPGLFVETIRAASGTTPADLEAETGVLAKGDVAISEASDRAARRWMRENPAGAAVLPEVRHHLQATDLIAGSRSARRASSRRRRA
jgi:hypothetical protein